MNIIGISRGTRFSPNHVGNDAAIYNKVMEELLRLFRLLVLFFKTRKKLLFKTTFLLLCSNICSYST